MAEFFDKYWQVIFLAVACIMVCHWYYIQFIKPKK